ncbi:MAG: hypothetical protein KGH75_10735, partial [Rhodospirillales bacterium]|nr:hypothetical protein [Rhodospirillales bacterium]
MKDFKSALLPAASLVCLLSLADCGSGFSVHMINSTTTTTHAAIISKAGEESTLRTTSTVAAPAPASADNTASTGSGISFSMINNTGPVSMANKAGAPSTAGTTEAPSTVNTPSPANTASTISTPSPASAMPADPTTYCPQVAVLQQAQTVTLFLPGRSDVASQISTAQLSSVSGDCVYQKKHHEGLLEVRFTSNFLADNGPANNGQPITLPWFVAITKGSQIIEKQDYQITLKFDGNMSVAAASSKPVKIELPAVPDSAGIQILTGFEMTPDQL